MARWEVIASLALALPLLGLGLAPASGDASTQGQTHHVHIDGFTMVPSSLTIQAGDTVEWHNHDGTSHNAAEGSPGGDAPAWDTPFLGPQGSATITFTKQAVYAYYCEAHPGSMTGYELVVVDPAGTDAPDLTITELTAEETQLAQAVEITAVITNQGALTAPSTELGLTAQGSGSATSIGSTTVPLLAPGEAATVTARWDTVGSVGAFEITATADDASSVQELQENNNQATTRICLPDADGLTCNVPGQRLLG